MPRPSSTEAARPQVGDNQPIHTIRHRNLKASIWKNQTAKGAMYKVMVVRSYLEGDAWHDTHSFSFDELMNVAKLFSDAHSYISAERAKDSIARQRSPKPDRAGR